MTLLAGLRLPWQPPTSPTNIVTPRAAQAPPVARIWVLTASAEFELDLRLSKPRVSDSLNHSAWPLADPGAMGDAAESPTFVGLEDILVVVPPEQRTDRAHRLHRTPQRVRVVVPPYEIVGTAHVPPGTQAIPFLDRHGGHFIAVTRATLRREGVNLGVVPVAIVNLRASVQLIAPDAVGAAPPPAWATT